MPRYVYNVEITLSFFIRAGTAARAERAAREVIQSTVSPLDSYATALKTLNMERSPDGVRLYTFDGDVDVDVAEDA